MPQPKTPQELADNNSRSHNWKLPILPEDEDAILLHKRLDKFINENIEVIGRICERYNRTWHAPYFTKGDKDKDGK